MTKAKTKERHASDASLFGPLPTKPAPEKPAAAKPAASKPVMEKAAPSKPLKQPAMKTVAPAKNAVAVHQPQKQAPARVVPESDSAGIWAIIERMAKNKEVDPDKLDRMLALQERILDRNAKTAFDQAMSQMQPELPVVDRKGLIEVREKTGTGKRDGALLQSTKFAKWDDINEAIKPVLHRHGFALTFRTGTAADGKLVVTGILSHSGGHREETMLQLAHDSSGSKNSVQAVGSSVSYGKRYVACALLNITTREEDDDGRASGKPKVIGEPLTDEQVSQILDLALAVKCPGAKLIAHLDRTKPKGHPVLAELADIPQSRFDEAVELLRNYEANAKDREAVPVAAEGAQ